VISLKCHSVRLICSVALRDRKIPRDNITYFSGDYCTMVSAARLHSVR
jgi:hypothetical protein